MTVIRRNKIYYSFPVKALFTLRIAKKTNAPIATPVTFKMGVPVERVDSEEYSFLYMRAGTPHGTTEYLLYIRADGSWHNFAEEFPSYDWRWRTKTFRDVTIDRAGDAVHLTCGEESFVIDLAKGTMRSMDSPRE